MTVKLYDGLNGKFTLRCGGVIEGCMESLGSYYVLRDGYSDICYQEDGAHHSINGDSIIHIDIIAFEEENPVFDWDTVKWGMAFLYEDGILVHYIGPSVVEPEQRVVVYDLPDNCYYWPTREQLTRAPEHDVGVG